MTPVTPITVFNQLRSAYPPESIKWVLDTKWLGPVLVPWDHVDDDDADSWAASHTPKLIRTFAYAIRNNIAHLDPVVMITVPSNDRLIIVDGHHRSLAYKQLGQDIPAFIGKVPDVLIPAAESTHDYQIGSTSPSDDAARSGTSTKASYQKYRKAWAMA